MKTYSIYLLDDDKVFLDAFEASLRAYLNTLSNTFTVQSFTGFADLDKAISLAQPDLIITDISLPDEEKTSISFLRDLQASGCKSEIIFLTGYLDYATDIFDLRPLYFILKSEYEQRIPNAIDLFLRKKQKQQAVLTLDMNHTTIVLPAEKVMFCERVRRKTIVCCTDRKFSVTAGLPEIAGRLPTKSFFFSHQSVLVNFRYVKSFSASTLIMADGTELPISRARSEEFRQAMAAYLGE